MIRRSTASRKDDFGEGPVWDKRTQADVWVDIIGNTIWRWTPGVGREVVLRPSGHANGMTFDKEGRLTVAGWCSRTICRFEHDGTSRRSPKLRRQEIQQPERHRREVGRLDVLDRFGRRAGHPRHGRRRTCSAISTCRASTA